MNTQLISVTTGELTGVQAQLVDARLLHEFLEVSTRFNDWIAKRISDYGFLQDIDFKLTQKRVSSESTTSVGDKKDYLLSLDMAKELGMIERTPKGREVRLYFIEMERIARGELPKQIPEKPTKKSLPGCLTLAQQDTIKALVKSKAESLPKEKQAGACIRMWSAIKTKFGKGYKEVETGEFINVVSLLGRLPLEGDLLDKPIPVDIEAEIERRSNECIQKFLRSRNSITIDFSQNGKPSFLSLNFLPCNIHVNNTYVVEIFGATINIHHVNPECDYLVLKKEELIKRLTA